MSTQDAVFVTNWTKALPTVVRGERIYLFAEDGTKYIDAASGVKVANLGHGVKEIADAMAAQAQRLAFAYTGAFRNLPQIELGERLVRFAPAGFVKAYFTSGGSEAVEVAIKLARQYQLAKDRPSRYKVVSRWNSYHGATLGAMSLTGQPGRRRDYLPLLIDFPHIAPVYCYRCPLGKTYPTCAVACAHELERTIRLEDEASIAGFIAEPVLGSSGNGLNAPPEYFPILRHICDRFDILLIADEVITGVGRTGRNFAIEHWGVTPDLIVTGKGLSGGYAPLGAVLIHQRVWDTLDRGHREGMFLGYTYSGNPVACATGVAALDYIERHGLVRRAASRGKQLERGLQRLAPRATVGEIRGKGLLWGIEFVMDKATKAPFRPPGAFANAVAQEALRRGLYINVGSSDMVDGAFGDNIGLAPPLVTTAKKIDQIVEILDEAIAAAEDTVLNRHAEGLTHAPA
jgi:adenosylmethionine-8-amino-7-oxononanoate aminotransferase